MGMLYDAAPFFTQLICMGKALSVCTKIKPENLKNVTNMACKHKSN